MAKFTNAPLPSLNLLSKSIFKKSSLNENLVKPWRIHNHLTLPISRSAWSFELIAKYRLIRSSNSSLNILFPSYFCNSSLAPLREMRANLFFYPIEKDGKPDLEEIGKILSKNNIDLVVGVHFFGNYIDFSELAHISEEHNIWFIEDCAHLLNLPESASIRSDFQLFSPHKFLPIPDGALLSVNKRIFKADLEIKDFEKLYKKYIKQESNRYKAYLWLLKRLLQKLNFGINIGIKDYYNDLQINTSESFFNPSMSKMSKALLSVLVNTLDQSNLARKENAAAWKSLVLSRYPSTEILIAEENVESIYLMGFKFPDVRDLQDALQWSEVEKFPICTWPDLPIEVLDNHDYFKQAIELRNNSIFFQVHSSIDKKNIESYLQFNKRK